jgi:hypothetical protein
MWNMRAKKRIKFFRKRNRNGAGGVSEEKSFESSCKSSEVSNVLDVSGISDEKLLVWNCGYSETDVPTSKIVAELNVKDGRLTISGCGEMMNYCLNGSIEEEVPWSACKRYIKTVVIGEGIKSIGDYAFADCEFLTSIDMSDGITRIGNGAFMNCKNLTAVNIPDSATIIGNMAFCYCKNLASINIPVKHDPKSNVKLGSCVFYGCDIILNSEKYLPNDIIHAVEHYPFLHDEYLSYTGGVK